MKILFLITAMLFLVSCASEIINPEQRISTEEEDSRKVSKEEIESLRANSCVRANLPMEIQFGIEGVPRPLNNERFDFSDIKIIAKNLDVSISGLLKVAIGSSADQLKIKSKTLDRNAIHSLAQEFWFHLIDRAPKTLNIEYCGDSNSVGNNVAASLIMHFSRACGDEEANPPQWTATPRTPDKCGYFVMFATALELSGYQVNNTDLLDEVLRLDTSR